MDALPVDVFQEILNHLVKPIDLETQWPIANSKPRALNPLLATCRLWRDVIMGTPSVWSCIQVNGPIDDRHVDYVRLRLERSGNMPLDICLQEVAGSESESPVREDESIDKDHLRSAHLLQCFTLVSGHSERIRRLELWTSTVSRDDLNVFSKSLPLLEELILVPPCGRYEDLIHDAWTVTDSRYFQGIPRLRRLDSHIACMVPTHEMPKLTFLSISLRGSPAYDFLWQTLALTPALEELHVYFPRNQWSMADPGAQNHGLALLNLERLAIFGYTSFFVWLEQLHAPNLTTLTVSIEWCDVISPLYRTLRDQIRHLIITTVDPGSGGYMDTTDTIALDVLESLSTFELRDIPEIMLRSSRQGFFQHLVDRVVESTDASPWSARVPALVLRRCRFNWRACESLLRFIGVRHGASAEYGRPILRLELVDTTFVKYGSYKPAGYDDITHYFTNARFERVSFDPTFDPRPYPDPVDEWDEWSDADDDGGVIGWHIFDR